MNTMRFYTYRYQAVLANGDVHYLGYSSEFIYGDEGTMKSKFGGRYACYEDCSWDEEEPKMPADLIKILHSSEIEEAWQGKNQWAADELSRMFSFCDIRDRDVVGMIVTFEYEGRWDFENEVETYVISRPQLGS